MRMAVAAVRRVWVLCAAAALAGCATPVTQRIAVDAGARAQEERIQKRLAVQNLARLEERLWTVGYGVLKAAASECGEVVRPTLGFRMLSRDMIPEAQRELYADALGLTEQLRVLAVYRGSAAEAAGLKVGDVIVDRASRALSPPGGKESREDAAARLTGPVSLTVLREGKPLTLTMTADLICDYPLYVSQGDEVNAYADGKSIVLSKGMLRFATEDRELALVIGHELGHNTMGHLTKKKQNALFGAVFDILAAAYGVNTQNAFMNAGAQAYSQDFEAEADYVGLYYVARAGYETKGAADFWRRMGAEHPSSIRGSHAASHPATTERFLALEKVSEEIDGKRSGGQQLVPNRVK